MWGWIQGGGTKGYPWNGVLTLPRILTLRPDDRLGMQPAPELSKLRSKHYSFKRNITLTENSPNILKDIKGDCLEIIVEFEPQDAKSFGLEVFCSPDGKEKTSIGYDLAAKRLFSGDKGGSFELLKGEKRLKLNIFLDKSVVEVYANERECITTRIFPKQPDSQRLNLFVKGGTVRLTSMDVWEMKSIW
jgi:beta-fructofuranosidase